MSVKLFHGDCLEVLLGIESNSIDAILCDMPYGTTQCKWDTPILFVPLWEQYHRITKKDSPIVLNSSQPFTSALVMSNPTEFKYEWIWDKRIVTGFLNAKIRPLVLHESILVFSSGKPPYFPLMTTGKERLKGARKGKEGQVYGAADSDVAVKSSLMYPKSILSMSNADRTNRVHPTQKPIALLEYLVHTYTKEGQTVLDNCMGSGTTGIACVRLNRNFVGIESNAEYFLLAKNRIEEAESGHRCAAPSSF